MKAIYSRRAIFGVCAFYLAAVVAGIGLFLLTKPAELDLAPGALDEIVRSTRTLRLGNSSRAPSATNARCFFDRFGKDDDSELRELEETSIAMPAEVRGKRDAILLHFKKRIGGYIHPKLMDAVSRCTDVLCFYEAVYGDRERAKLSYQYFLMTGVAVAVTDEIPQITPMPSATGEDLARFLFSATELRMLLRSAASISDPKFLFVLPRLRTIHKIPSDVLARSEQADVCGFANDAFVVLPEHCMLADWLKENVQVPDGRIIRLFQGHTTYLHEFGHALDHNLGQQRSQLRLRFSSWPEWKKICIPKTPNEKGVVVYSPQEPGFITGYASISTMEDFAESFAFYRFRPERVLERTPEKYEFLKTKVFNGVEFTKAAATQTLAKSALAGVLADIEAGLADCAGKSGSSIQPKFLKISGMSASEVRCLEARAEKIATEVYRDYQFKDPIGCDVTLDSMISDFFERNSGAIREATLSNVWARKLVTIRREMDGRLDPKEAFLESRARPSPKEFYEANLRRHLDSFRARITELDPALFAVQEKSYFAINDFDVVKQLTEETTRLRLASVGEILSPVRDQAYKRCLEKVSPLAAKDLLKRDFRPAVSSDFVGCMVREQSDGLSRTVRDALRGTAKPPSERFIDFAIEFATMSVEKDVQIKIDEELLEGEKDVVVRAGKSLATLGQNLKAIFAQPLLERFDTCRGVARKVLQKEVFAKSELARVTNYLQKLLLLEEEFCQENVFRNEAFLKEYEDLRNRISRMIFTLAFKRRPKDFPIGGSFSGNEVVNRLAFSGADSRGTCQRVVGEMLSGDPRLIEMSKTPKFRELVEAGVDEVCQNGRYAGRFVWKPSDRFIEFGGVRSLGFAEFYLPAKPTGAEHRLYLYALRRFLQFRSSDRLNIKH